MITQAEIKYIRALQHKKYRKLHGSFVVEGEKIVAELLSSDYSIEGVFALSEWMEQHRDLITGHVKTTTVAPATLSRISSMSTPNKALAVVRMPEQIDHVGVWDGISVYLDNIQDPGNLGTIVRTADWFGIQSVFCSMDTADLYNPKVIQATMGSFLRVRVRRIGLHDLLSQIDMSPVVYGAALNGENLFQTRLETPALVIIGNESHGISPDCKPFISRWIKIPGKEMGAESLNASVAAAIMMAWFSKG